MSEFTHARMGLELVEKRLYDDAIPLLSKAIKSVQSPNWLLARAHAYQQTKQPEKALADAELAYIKASERQQPQSRTQMILAQYRRAVIFYKLGRFADSDACCVWSMQLIEGKNFRTEEDDVSTNTDADGDYGATCSDALATSSMPQSDPSSLRQGPAESANTSQPTADWSRAYVWRTQALTAMNALEKGAAGRKVTALRIPKTPVLVDDGATESATKTTAPAVAEGKQVEVKTDALKEAPRNAKLRVDFYQTDKKINLTVYIKGVDKNALSVRCANGTNLILDNLPRTGVASGTASLEFSKPVNPDPSSLNVNVTPHKIEISMEKANAGKWGEWGVQNEEPTTTTSSGVQDIAQQVATPTSAASMAAEAPSVPEKSTENDKPIKAAGPPAYPTSAKSGPKDWEHIGDDVEDDSVTDANAFFKSLYAGSTPEQQRAMMKSFTESNGTTLSTDWEDVKSRTVETHPPEGVEAKKWD